MGSAEIEAVAIRDMQRYTCAWFDSIIPVKGKKLFVSGIGVGNYVDGFEDLGAEFQNPLDVLDSVPVNYFDIVFCVEMLNHIPKNSAHQTFLNLIKITKPDGLLYFQFNTDKVGFKTWGSWLGEMLKLSYPWCQNYELTEALKNSKVFPDLPLPSWRFMVNQKSNY